MGAFYTRALLVGAAILALLPGRASAQDNGQSDRPPQAQQRQQQQHRLAMLAQRLNLTDDQKRQWAQIQRQTAQKVREARKDDSLTEEQMQAQLREIHKDQKQQIMALLTSEQQNALKEFWEEQRQKQQQNKASDNNSSGDSSSSGSSSTQNSDTAKDNDDLFAGMVSDDPAPSQPTQNRKPAHK